MIGISRGRLPGNRLASSFWHPICEKMVPGGLCKNRFSVSWPSGILQCGGDMNFLHICPSIQSLRPPTYAYLICLPHLKVNILYHVRSQYRHIHFARSIFAHLPKRIQACFCYYVMATTRKGVERWPHFGKRYYVMVRTT